MDVDYNVVVAACWGLAALLGLLGTPCAACARPPPPGHTTATAAVAAATGAALLALAQAGLAEGPLST